MTSARVVTRPVGGSPLAALASAREGAAFFTPIPNNERAWRARAVAVRDGAAPHWLEAVSPAIGARGAAARRLERVAQGRGAVVTSGQQPGLFGGPLYTLAKALSALELADVLEEQTGMPTAPVFWAATDDADFDEASVTYVASAQGLRELRLAPASRAGVVMADQPLGDVEPLLAALTAACGSAAAGPTLDVLHAAYREMPTVGGAYVRLLRDLLEPLGIAVLDASHPAVRRAAQPILVRALERAGPIDAALRERERALRDAGLEPQVSHVDDLSLVFAIDDGVKQRIPLRESRDSKWTTATLGPNVLLRPVVERALLPTVAYAAGPAELAYFAQTTVVGAQLGIRDVVAVPRWSCTVIEPYVERILERHALAIADVQNAHAVRRTLIERHLSPHIMQSLASLRAAVHREAEALRRALRSEATSLMDERVITGGEFQIMHRVDRLERRVVAAAKRRERELMAQVDAAEAALFPMGQPQERVLNWIPMLAREGPALLHAMREGARAHALGLLGLMPQRGSTGHRAASIAT